ncbi:MAG: hypothetical protein M1839_001666 [Geoglossum umbratile]|nr:MAG: hypothetical protein M1839_001666 [Geoglossum umbratile]
MSSLTIIPYTPVPTKIRHCTKDAPKLTNDRGKEHQTKPSTVPVDTPQLRSTAVAGNAGNLTMPDDKLPLEGHVSAFVQSQSHVCGQQYLDRDSSVNRDESGEDSDIETDSLYKDSGDTEPTTETESNSGNPRIWDGITEIEARGIESGIGDTEVLRQPLKRKAGTRGQGSQVNPWVIADSDTDTESESDSENWGELVWKKRKVNSPWRTIETDDEVEVGIGAGDIQSESDSASESEGHEQSHTSPAALSAHQPALFKSDDRVNAQSVARVGGNGEWGIHGIIGKEVIEGKVYYCVDWEPTMVSSDELLGAQGLVREFEVKEQARLRRADNRQKRGGRHRKQK